MSVVFNVVCIGHTALTKPNKIAPEEKMNVEKEPKVVVKEEFNDLGQESAIVYPEPPVSSSVRVDQVAQLDNTMTTIVNDEGPKIRKQRPKKLKQIKKTLDDTDE